MEVTAFHDEITIDGHTPHPTPYTLHLTPFIHTCSLHPSPYTLHPTTYTRHPTPYTLTVNDTVYPCRKLPTQAAPPP